MTYTEIEQLQTLLRDEESFTKYFKQNFFDDGIGRGEWRFDGRRGWRLVLPDGSYIRLKFFDTIKRVYNSKNIEVPGREALLSYIDISVMPAGIKGYAFITDTTQFPIAYVKGRPPAKETHAKTINSLMEKANLLGIDLSVDGAWETYYVRGF